MRRRAELRSEAGNSSKFTLTLFHFIAATKQNRFGDQDTDRARMKKELERREMESQVRKKPAVLYLQTSI